MADTIILKTQLTGADVVLKQLDQIEAVKEKLSSKPIEVNVKASKQTASQISAMARLVKEQNALAIAQEKTKQITKQAEIADKQATAATEKRVAAEKNLEAAEKRRQTAQTNKETVEKRTLATEKQVTLEQEKQKTSAANLAVQQEKTATATEKHAAAQTNLESKLLGTTTGTDKLSAAMSTLGSRLLNAGINYFTQQLTEALGTMKDVDSELTTIKKVTGASDDYISGLSDRAYETASKYGVTASDYLESVASFSRAGYKDAAEGLAEVATKTQLVGEVTSETANEMLIAMDTAYELGGSIESLSLILDQANEIDNNYATTIEKIAEAMPIVASVASNAGISQEKLVAALGTITASTQESGTQAARAFRSIILNIIGDTTTEIEDGVTYTTEDIKTLSDVLWKYSSDAMKATQATGEIVDPMEAIAGLSKAFKEGALTEAEIFDIASSLGGKLRTNELLALIQNFDTYEEMLEKMASASGSAEKEIDSMLTSWETKTNQLQNSWTQLVQNIIDTDWIKGVLTEANDFLTLLNDIISPDTTDFQDAYTDAKSEYEELTSKAEELTEREKNRLEYLQQQLAVLKQQSEWSEKSNLNSTAKELRSNPYYSFMSGAGSVASSYREQWKSGSLSTAEYGAQLQTLSEKYSEVGASLEELEEAGYEAKGAQKKYYDAAVEGWKQLSEAIAEYSAETGKSVEVTGESTDTAEEATEAVEQQAESYETLKDNIQEASDAITAFKNASETNQDDNFKSMAEYYSDLMEEIASGRINSNTAQAGYDLFLSDEQRENLGNDAQKMAEYVQSLGSLKAMLADGTDAGAGFSNWLYEAADAEGNLYNANGDLIASFSEAADGLSFNVESLEDLAEYSGVSEDVILTWAQAMGVYGSELYNTADEALALAEQMGVLTEAADGTKNVDLETFTAKLQEAGESQDEINQLVTALQDVDGVSLGKVKDQVESFVKVTSKIPETEKVKVEADTSSATVEVTNLFTWLAEKFKKVFTVNVSTSSVFGRSAKGGKSEVGGPTLVNEEGPEIIQEGDTARIAGGGQPTVTVLEPGAFVYTAPQTKKMLSGVSIGGSFPARAGGTFKTVRTSGSGSSSSSRKSSSSSSGSSSASDYWSELETAVKAQLEEAKDARDAELDSIEAQIDALKDAKDTEEDRLELEEKILAVQEAQTKLANAQAERTVRMYNAATGQWEWIANQKDVQSAQKSLTSAQESLEKYKAEKEYDAQVAALEAQKDLVNERYEELENEWEEILSSIEEPLREIADILSDVRKSGTDREKSATGDVQTLASAITSFITGTPAYDSGGVLSGLGGIKATNQDEIVLSPALSAKILSPTQNAQYDAFANALGAVYGMPSAGIPSAVSNAYGASTDSHDTVYSFPGGIQLSETQANSTTLGDIARQLRVLNLT